MVIITKYDEENQRRHIIGDKHWVHRLEESTVNNKNVKLPKFIISFNKIYIRNMEKFLVNIDKINVHERRLIQLKQFWKTRMNWEDSLFLMFKIIL